MKQPFLIATLLALGLAAAHAQDQAATFDAEAAKAKLSADVAKTPSKFFTKGIGGDPVTKRFYTKDAVVVTHASGAKEEHPYVAVPLLFQKNSDELFDSESRENVAKVAKLLKDLNTNGASFAIEGHASAEGDAQHNFELSRQRAAKIQALLHDHGVPSEELSRVEGFGSQHAQFQDPQAASESQLQQDRRVLVVRER